MQERTRNSDRVDQASEEREEEKRERRRNERKERVEIVKRTESVPFWCGRRVTWECMCLWPIGMAAARWTIVVCPPTPTYTEYVWSTRRIAWVPQTTRTYTHHGLPRDSGRGEKEKRIRRKKRKVRWKKERKTEESEKDKKKEQRQAGIYKDITDERAICARGKRENSNKNKSKGKQEI